MEIKEKILNVLNDDEASFLRSKTSPYDFSAHSKKETGELVKTMRRIMERANGIGLAANQIGLNLSVFTAKVSDKFYAIFNPRVVKHSVEEAAEQSEGCLSVPQKWGGPRRSAKITLEGFDKNGRKIKIKAWGLLATIFQHETDHLDGILFIDKLK